MHSIPPTRSSKMFEYKAKCSIQARAKGATEVPERDMSQLAACLRGLSTETISELEASPRHDKV